MNNTTKGNEDRPEDNQLPKINLEEAFVNKYGEEEGRRQYNKIREESSIQLPNQPGKKQKSHKLQNLRELLQREKLSKQSETEKLDQLIGKEERISQYGITREEMRSRPVVLEYETFDGTNIGNKVTYVWNAVAERDYSLLEEMSCVETIAYLLTRAPVKKTDGTLPTEQNKERFKADKGLLRRCVLTTENAGTLFPKGKYIVGGKPSADERERPLLEYLRPGKDSNDRDVWHQKFSTAIDLDGLVTE